MNPLYLPLSAFVLGTLASVMQLRTTAQLAKWLYENQRSTWIRLGRPGTTFFKGQNDNGYLARTSSLLQLNKGNWPDELTRTPEGSMVAQNIRSHRRWGRIDLLSFALCGALVLWFAVNDPK